MPYLEFMTGLQQPPPCSESVTAEENGLIQQAADTDSKRVNGIGITIGRKASTDNRSGLLFYLEGLFEKGQSPDEEEDDDGQNDGTDNGPIDNHLDLMPL